MRARDAWLRQGALLGSACVLMLAVGFAASATGPAPATGCTEAALGGARAEHAALAADCDALLASRAALAGAGALNWSAGAPLAEWDGVTVSGEPPRVIGLDLRARGLTGAIPLQLADLTALESLALSGNMLTGCIPNALWSVADKDLPDVGLADCNPPVSIAPNGAPFGPGTYRIEGVTFNVPVGAHVSIPWIETQLCPEETPCNPLIIIDDESSGSWMALDTKTGAENYRIIQSQIGASEQNSSKVSAVNSLFDHIANSARLTIRVD